MTERLSLAVAYNDENIVKMFINDSEVDVNHRTPPLGRTMLHLAVRNDNMDIARQLIDLGADVDAFSDDQLTAMHIAVANRSKSMVELLIKHRASVNPKVKFNGKTPLYMAVEHDCQEIVEILLKNGARIEEATILNTTVLHVALRINACRLALLLANYASGDMLDVEDNLEGKTILHMAVERRNRELAKLLLQKGANAEKPHSSSSTPLRMALARRDVEMAAILLRYGASKSSDECLRYAMRHRCRDVAKTLLETGAVDINQLGKDGSSALYAAVLSGHLDMVQLCLEHGASLATLGPDKVPILFYAIKRGNAEVIQLLIERGALAHDIVYRGHKYSLLDVAARCRDVCVCKMLLRRGLPINPSCPKAELAFAVKCIALLQAEGESISEENLKLLESHKLWSRFHDKCLAEIELLKKESLVGSISFFDLLTKGENELAAYARNEDFVVEFPRSNNRSRFVIYGENLALNFSKARLRNSLLQKAAEDFGRLQEFSLTSVCAHKVLAHLSNDELRSFIKSVCECKLDRHVCLPQMIISL